MSDEKCRASGPDYIRCELPMNHTGLHRHEWWGIKAVMVWGFSESPNHITTNGTRA